MAASTVLLIDDDQDSITIYSLILRHYGYDVVPATDGATGLRLALELKPDIVVTELFLPQFEATSLLAGLRGDDRTASTPVIVLDSIPLIGAKVVGAEDRTSRLTKPCEPSRLLEEVGRLLGQRPGVM
jgi:DNA-binding response OmpR family regulator